MGEVALDVGREAGLDRAGVPGIETYASQITSQQYA